LHDVLQSEIQNEACDDGRNKGGHLGHLIHGIEDKDGDGGVGESDQDCRQAENGQRCTA